MNKIRLDELNPTSQLQLLRPAKSVKDKKEKKKSQDRAIQSLFKTLSKNNYSLHESIDRKANILITVNAIILSLLIGSSQVQGLFPAFSVSQSILLIISSAISIILALFSIKPFLLGQEFLKSEKDHLLNYSAITKLNFREYKTKAKRIIKKEKRIYDSMVEDIYFIGKNVERKNYFLNAAALVFGGGFILSVVLRIIILVG